MQLVGGLEVAASFQRALKGEKSAAEKAQTGEKTVVSVDFSSGSLGQADVKEAMRLAKEQMNAMVKLSDEKDEHWQADSLTLTPTMRGQWQLDHRVHEAERVAEHPAPHVVPGQGEG